MDGARGARTLITVSVTADGCSSRDALEMAVQLDGCMSEVESRSASVFQAIYPRPVACGVAPWRRMDGRLVERAGLARSV